MTDQHTPGDQPSSDPQSQDTEPIRFGPTEPEQTPGADHPAPPEAPLEMPQDWGTDRVERDYPTRDYGEQQYDTQQYDTQQYATPEYAGQEYAGQDYAGQDYEGQAGPRHDRLGTPRWLWPAIVALALVVGLVGGALGGALYEELDNEVAAGLDPVRTRTAPPLAEGNQSISAVAQELLPSTVQILAGSGESGATGSGFVLDKDGHVVTNQHVVAAVGADGGLRVVDFEGRSYEASVVGSSQVYDLAVLELVDAGSLRAATLGASQALLVGDPVVAFGAPLGLSQTVTSGIVSALNRPVTTGENGEDDTSFINAVQTDAAINPGNSGGPLVNLAGQVVGVNSAIATTGGLMREAGNIGVGFAIPIEQVRTTADQILRTGEARYPVIGAQVQTSDDTELQGARIDEVMDDSPAERAGLSQDDVVIAVDDVRISDGISLIVSIRTHQPGETLTFTVLRDGDEKELSITLDSEVG